jgi:hypothetical protein
MERVEAATTPRPAGPLGDVSWIAKSLSSARSTKSSCSPTPVRRKPSSASRTAGELGRVQLANARGSPARWLIAAQRRETLHRQRLEGLRVPYLHARRDRGQGPPRRADVERAWMAYRSASATTRWACAAATSVGSTSETRVPKGKLLGEPSEGFRIAMRALNNERLSRGTGSVGAAKWSARPSHRSRQAAAPVRPAARRVLAGPGRIMSHAAACWRSAHTLRAGASSCDGPRHVTGRAGVLGLTRQTSVRRRGRQMDARLRWPDTGGDQPVRPKRRSRHSA